MPRITLTQLKQKVNQLILRFICGNIFIGISIDPLLPVFEGLV